MICKNVDIKANNQDIMISKKSSKSKLFNIIRKSKFKNKYSNIFNFFLFNIIIFLLLKKTENGYIEIRVNQKRFNKLISDYYQQLPNKIYINGNIINPNPNIRNINVNQISDWIKLEWDNALSDFSYMFSDLTSITEVYMDRSIFDPNQNIVMNY